MVGAERIFRQALELQPRSADALVGLADLASWRGEAEFAPKSSYHLEVYQSLLTRLEVSLGARRMNFPGQGVSMAVGSASLYRGHWLPTVRVIYADIGAGTEFT